MTEEQNAETRHVLEALKHKLKSRWYDNEQKVGSHFDSDTRCVTIGKRDAFAEALEMVEKDLNKLPLPSKRAQTEIVVAHRVNVGFSEAAHVHYAKLAGFSIWPERDKNGWFTTYWRLPPEQRIQLPGNYYSLSSSEREAINQTIMTQQFSLSDVARHDPLFVQTVRDLKHSASVDNEERYEILTIEGDKYYINECEGCEELMTPETVDWIIVKPSA